MLLSSLTFRQLVTHCCVAPELELRRAIARELGDSGFSVQRDGYASYRGGAPERCNLLLVRGAAKVALVAHTDVCRDHHAFTNDREPPVPTPVVEWRDGREILIDRDRAVQLGGDDRLGVAIALWLALHTTRDLALLFTTDEEVGLASARACRFPELRVFELLVQLDRGNHTGQLVDEIRGVRLCRTSARDRLLSQLAAAGLPREAVEGFGTDVFALIDQAAAREAINVTCGYHDNLGYAGGDFIDWIEAAETIRAVEVILDTVHADWTPPPLPTDAVPVLTEPGGPGAGPSSGASGSRGSLPTRRPRRSP